MKKTHAETFLHVTVRTMLALVVLAGNTLAGCTGSSTGDVCGMDSAVPSVDDVANGTGEASRDGSSWSGEGTYSFSSGSITIGLLDFIVSDDENGDSTSELVAAETFPICITLGERDEQTGQANYVDGGYVTGADHGGTLSILSADGDILTGRFSVDLSTTNGDETSFTDGVFRAEPR